MIKVLAFGLFGAVGCLLGGLLGELLLDAARRLPVSQAPAQAAPGEILFSKDLQDRLKLKNAGTGDVEIALIWSNDNDLDLHCIEPGDGPVEEREISFRKRKSKTGGHLDVDMNDAPPFSKTPVEHIVWQPPRPAPAGNYQVIVEHRVVRGGKDPTEFRCEVTVKGNVKEAFTRQFAGSISKGERKEIGEFTVEAKPVPKPTLEQMLRPVAITAAWTALLALGLALALVVGQNLYLRRRLLSLRQLLGIVLGAVLAGALAGAAGQGMFGFFDRETLQGWLGALSDEALEEIGRFLGWLILGGLLGWCMSVFIPNLPGLRSLLAGSVGGVCGAWAFVDLSRELGDQGGRLAGAAILGLFIGWMVALVEAAFREAWLEIDFGKGESRKVALGREPVAVGSDPSCAVYAGGALPVALRYRLEGGRVLCEDVATGQTHTLAVGDSRTVGRLTLRLRGLVRSEGPAGEPAARAPAARAAGAAFVLRLKSGTCIPLADHTRLTPAQLPGVDVLPATAPVAEVSRHPKDPSLRGLKNLSYRIWAVTVATGEKRSIEPGKNIQLAAGTRIDFGKVVGEIEAAPRPRLALPSLPTVTAPATRTLLRFVLPILFLTGLGMLGFLDWERRRTAHGAVVSTEKPTTETVFQVERAVLSGHTEQVMSVAFSPRGDLVASSGKDKTTRIWRISDGKQLHVIEGNGHIAFSRDGRTLARTSITEPIALWRVDTGERQALTLNESTGTTDLAFSPDGSYLAASCLDHRIRLWRLSDGGIEATFEGHPSLIRKIVFTADSNLLVSGSDDKTVRVWDIAGRQSLRTLEGLPAFIHGLAVNRDGSYIASASCMAGAFDEQTRLLKPGVENTFFRLYSGDGRVLSYIVGHQTCVTSVAFSPTNPELLVSASSDNSIGLWRVPDGQLFDTLGRHDKEIWSIDFSSDGKYLVSGGNDCTVRLWNIPKKYWRQGN